MLVIDASITLAWTLPDEETGLASEVLAQVVQTGALVPAIWTLEVANAHVVAERRSRLTRRQAEESLSLLRELPIRVAPPMLEADLGRVVTLGRSHQLSAYDAAYLELAERSALELATLDKSLRSTARRIGVRLVTARW